MHLVEAEAIGPIEGEEPVLLPPRPPHRRVSVSFMFTMSVLIGTVVLIYVLLPARHDVVVTETIAHHRDPGSWDEEMTAPSAEKVRGWAIGVVGAGVPLPHDMPEVIGARRLEILKRHAALIRMRLGGDAITYLVQRVRGIGPEHVSRNDGDLHAEARRRGKFSIVVVGPLATSKTWIPALLGP